MIYFGGILIMKYINFLYKQSGWRLTGMSLALVICASLAFSSCASSGGASGGPNWTRNPYNKYNKKTDVAAVGTGNNRQDAEKKAFGNLVAVFGQSIKVNEKLIESYQEAVKGGVTSSIGKTSYDSTISTAAGMDSLVGAEIGEVWDDGKGTVYAVAVLNKEKAIQTYSNMIKSNKEMIDKLVNMSDKEKYTLDGFGRYQFAAIVADMNISYGNLLSQIGAPKLAQGLKKGNDYRIEATNITKDIPVTIKVNKDRDGRIAGAFAKAFTELGFKVGGNSRYVFNVNIVITSTGSQVKKAKIKLTANLTDTGQKGRTVMPPYTFDLTGEGDFTQSGAEDLAFRDAEKKINKEYKQELSNGLSRMYQTK